MAPEYPIQLANPMDRYLSGGVPINSPFATTQMRHPFVRREQRTKYFLYSHRFEPLVAATIGIRDAFGVDGDAEFHVYKQSVFALDTNLVQRQDDTVSFEISPVGEAFNFTEGFLSHLGSGRLPLVLDPPMRLPRNAVFTAIANSRNSAALNTNIFIAHHGCKVYQRPLVDARVYEQAKPYKYFATFAAFGGSFSTGAAIPAGQTVTMTIRLDGDSDFDVKKLTMLSDAAILIQIESDSDLWFLRPQRSELFGGTNAATPVNSTFSGETPFILPAPRLITRAGYIAVIIQNLDLVNANRVQIGFHGARLYPGGGYTMSQARSMRLVA